LTENLCEYLRWAVIVGSRLLAVDVIYRGATVTTVGVLLAVTNVGLAILEALSL
jgi:hypothetical protein